MAELFVEAEPRTITGKKVSQLRANGLVPVTVYGSKVEPMSLQIPYRPLQVVLMKAGGTSLIDIKVNGETHTVLAREVQRDVLKGTILHADFLVIDATSKITAAIPVHLVGESPAVEARVGILLTGANSIQVSALPDKLMSYVEVDLSVLEEMGDTITVRDLDLGDDIDILDDPDEMLARVAQSSAARAEMLAEEEGEEEEEMDAGSEPEVIARGRDEDED
ncbi:MAG: 50S ribosomal protein L25 [Phototrophicaceae bacterium]